MDFFFGGIVLLTSMSGNSLLYIAVSAGGLMTILRVFILKFKNVVLLIFVAMIV